jgi:hypothetical protein
MATNFTLFGMGACNCAAPCTQTFTVNGCNGLAYPSVPTVNVFTLGGGTLLASGTVDGSGNVTLSWSGGTGSYHVTVTGASTRFVAFAANLTLTCGGSLTITLTAAAAYICGLGCMLPIARVLTCTFSTGQVVTMTYGTGGLTGWGSGNFTPTGGGTANIAWANTGIFNLSIGDPVGITCFSGVPTYSCPPSLLATIGYAGGACSNLGTGASITE